MSKSYQQATPSALSESPRFVSFGVGVQSSAMLLMLDAGELPGPLPEAALFADTGWEPDAVYRQLDYLKRTV
jgi:3'-phosphoadenosine 5'-phosphosulfate sulfotransferase (PAPS reductase)/FAD synthetase